MWMKAGKRNLRRWFRILIRKTYKNLECTLLLWYRSINGKSKFLLIILHCLSGGPTKNVKMDCVFLPPCRSNGVKEREACHYFMDACFIRFPRRWFVSDGLRIVAASVAWLAVFSSHSVWKGQGKPGDIPGMIRWRECVWHEDSTDIISWRECIRHWRFQWWAKEWRQMILNDLRISEMDMDSDHNTYWICPTCIIPTHRFLKTSIDPF